MGRSCNLFPGSPFLGTLLVLVLLLSAVAFQVSNGSRELAGQVPSKCQGRSHVLECSLCDAECCASAMPCFTPLGCRPGDCN